MHMLNQMDPSLYAEVLRKQEQAWTDMMAAFEDVWKRSFRRRWTVAARISIEEVLADLDYGRQ